MLHPDQFQVNEAWILFKLNDQPIHTSTDGDIDFIALMDAYSCYMLGSLPVPAGSVAFIAIDAEKILQQGYAESNQWPVTLFIPSHQPVQPLKREVEHLGIDVIQVPEDQLMVFVGEAKQAFRERFG